MLNKIVLLGLVAGSLMFAGCCNTCQKPAKSCNKCKVKVVKEKKSCKKCKLVYEDGTPAECCRTVTKFSH